MNRNSLNRNAINFFFFTGTIAQPPIAIAVIVIEMPGQRPKRSPAFFYRTISKTDRAIPAGQRAQRQAEA